MYDMKKIMVFTLFHIRKCIISQNWSLMPWKQPFWDEIRAFRNYIFCNFHYIFCRFWLHKYYIFWAQKLHIFTGSRDLYVYTTVTHCANQNNNKSEFTELSFSCVPKTGIKNEKEIKVEVPSPPGVRLEPATFGFWVRRSTTAPSVIAYENVS